MKTIKFVQVKPNEYRINIEIPNAIKSNPRDSTNIYLEKQTWKSGLLIKPQLDHYV